MTVINKKYDHWLKLHYLLSWNYPQACKEITEITCVDIILSEAGWPLLFTFSKRTIEVVYTKQVFERITFIFQSKIKYHVTCI